MAKKWDLSIRQQQWLHEDLVRKGDAGQKDELQQI